MRRRRPPRASLTTRQSRSGYCRRRHPQEFGWHELPASKVWNDPDSLRESPATAEERAQAALDGGRDLGPGRRRGGIRLGPAWEAVGRGDRARRPRRVAC